MAYDAATGTVGPVRRRHASSGIRSVTPGPGTARPGPSSTRPPARLPGSDAAMAYDAATGTVGPVRRRGNAAALLGDTWTWDGTTWTKQHPATSPPARACACDGLRRGHRQRGPVRRHRRNQHARSMTPGPGTAPPGPSSTRPPARLPGPARRWPTTRPPATWSCSAAINSSDPVFNDTWTWDGTTWTKQHPATSPPPGWSASMAYDAATGNVVLFGGDGGKLNVRSTPGPGDDLTWMSHAIYRGLGGAARCAPGGPLNGRARR